MCKQDIQDPDPGSAGAAHFIGDYLNWAFSGFKSDGLLPAIAYRGHSDYKWQLLPTLCRHNLPSPYLRQTENAISKRFQESFDLSSWHPMEVLAYARHHDAPTRLLDWSESALTGLWFAVEDRHHDELDGTVYQLNLINGMPNQAPVNIMLGHEIDLAAFDSPAWVDAAKPYQTPLLVFRCPHRVEKGERQSSIFTIPTLHNDFALKPLEITLKDDSRLKSYPVPARVKRRLREMLCQLGIDPYSLNGDALSLGKDHSIRLETVGFRMKGAPLPGS